jgi:hypothetical protein
MSLEPIDPVVPSARVERKFFSITRWFGLIATTMALAAALIAGAGGGLKFFNIPDTHIRTPTTSYDDFRQSAEASRQNKAPENIDTTLNNKQAAAARASAEAEFEKRLKPYLDAIVASLSAYGTKTAQAKPSAQSVGDYIRQWMQEIEKYGPDELAWKYAEGLSVAVRDLASDGDRLAKLDVTDPGRVRWDSFIEWYSKSYVKQMRAELQRIDAEKMRALSSVAEAPMYFYAASIAFGIFVLGTILLVLLRIELNTRGERSESSKTANTAVAS